MCLGLWPQHITRVRKKLATKHKFNTVRAGFTDYGDQCKPSFSVSSNPKSLQIQNIFNVCVNFFTKEIVNTKKFGKTFTEDE